MSSPERPDPESLLRQIKEAERSERAGRLKVFMGYASGVGKSFRLFDEGRRRRDRGEDVVVAAVQAEMSPEVAQIVRGLETVPVIDTHGNPVIDVLSLLRRRPAVCLVDGAAYDNPPGSRHAKRCEDIEELLAHGISVITSLNLDYLDDQQEFIQSTLGRTTGQLVPRAFLDRADEVVVVDTPAAADTAERAHQLALLRSRTLLLTADVVDRQLEDYLRLHGLQSSWGTQERILVAMTPRANAAVLLASGRRNADRFHGELFAVYVTQEHLTDEDRLALSRNAMLAEAQEARLDVLEGTDPIAAILDYARAQGITQIFVGHNLRRTWRSHLGGTPLDRLIRDAEGIDVRVFPHSTGAETRA